MFAHYSYCRPNEVIHRRTGFYQRNGHLPPKWINPMWEGNPGEVLTGASVARFRGEHPPAMQDFPFEEFKTEVREDADGIKIVKKHW